MNFSKSADPSLGLTISESEVRALHEEIATLNKEKATLSEENAALKAEVEYLKQRPKEPPLPRRVDLS